MPWSDLQPAASFSHTLDTQTRPAQLRVVHQSDQYLGISSGSEEWNTSNAEWASYFPSCEEGHLLYCQYFSSVHPIVHLIHRPSFDLEYYKASLVSPDLASNHLTFKALLLATYLAAASSLQPPQSVMMFGINKQTMIAKLKMAAEKALMEANYMNSIDLQTLQAFTIYLVIVLKRKMWLHAANVHRLYGAQRTSWIHIRDSSVH